MEPINVDFTGSGKSSKGKGKDAYLVPEKSVLKIIISLIGTVIGGAVAYYFMLPPMNFKSTDMYVYFGVVLAIFVGLLFLTSGAFLKPEYTEYVKKRSIIPIIIAGVLVAIVGVGMVISNVVFRAKSYSQIITVDEETSFTDEIKEVDFSSVPVLDNAAAAALANRTLGDLASIGAVSQFEVSAYFSQINYKNNPVKLTTLAYGDIFKWFKNTGEGLPGYIIVNMVTQKSELVTLPEGQYIRYSIHEHFGKYLMRHVRFAYPTYIFDTPHFEIDEEGNPYWLCPILDKTIGLFGGTDAKGVVLVNAVTGEMIEYDMETVKTDPTLQWIDIVYTESILIEQFDYYGKYQKGFINSVLGQDNVRMSTEGANYLAQNDDVYLYTGVTSATNDQAIIGFVLINMRTKDASFYSISGAKETSAQASAQGEVQDYKYTATFPILLNINGQPTYFMSLKDSDNLVKRYAMVNVENYQVVAVGQKISECTEQYVERLKQNNINIKVDIEGIDDITPEDTDAPEVETETVKGTVTDIRTAVMGGESVYFIEVDDSGIYYTIEASKAENVVILNEGDKVTITFEKSESEIVEAESIK